MRELGLDDDQDKTVLTVAEVESLLSKMFSKVDTSISDQHNCELSVELSLGWILKCYDV